MKRNAIIISLFMLLVSIDIYAQDMTGYEREVVKNKVIIYHIESHTKPQGHLFDFDTLESFEQADGANKTMRATMEKQDYSATIKSGFTKNLTNAERSVMHEQNIKVFYKLDADGNVYEIGFILKESAEEKISKVLFDKIVSVLEDTPFEVKTDELPTIYKNAASNGKRIWTSMMLPSHFWDSTE